MPQRSIPVASVTLLLCLCPLAAAFQAPGPDSEVTIVPRFRPASMPGRTEVPRPDLRVDSALVQIPVHVTTQAGTSVTTLDKTSFHLFEDNVEQRITHFTKEDGPISIGLLFDASGSMHNKMRKCTEAAGEFFKTANLEDEFFLVEFSERPKLAVPFTSDSNEIYRRITHTRPFGRTSLLDAIHMALGQMKNARNLRKAIVIISDGGDNRSRFTASEIKSAMLESDVQVYAMGIFDPEETRHTPEEEKGPKLLAVLANTTGGHHYAVDDINDLPDISASIGRELREQYLIGYSSANPERDGKYRRVRVSVNPSPELPKPRVNHRLGYYAPAQ
jgi:Ca-activated chloride channel family protein